MDYLYQYGLYSSSATYGYTPVFVHRDSLDGNGYKGFSSLYLVTQEAAEAVVKAGTTQGFKGVVWSERLWLDFDSYEAAEQAELKLITEGVDYVGYDTGGRGAHFGILRNTAPSHLLPLQDRKWAEEHFPEADKSIYTHLHPFRIPGTTHDKTGGVKRLVCEQRGSAIVLPQFKKEQLHISTPSSSEGRRKSIFNCYRVMREMTPSTNGERHYSLVRLIYALKDDAKVSKEEALYWCNEWNKILLEPKSDAELEKAIQSIY